MKIELEQTPDHGWKVRCGEVWDDYLTRGEALETVASILFTGKAPYLKTDYQHELWNLRYGIKPKLIAEKTEQTK